MKFASRFPEINHVFEFIFHKFQIRIIVIYKCKIFKLSFNMSSLSTACTSHHLREYVCVFLYMCVHIRFAWNGWWVFTRFSFLGKIQSITFENRVKIITRNFFWMAKQQLARQIFSIMIRFHWINHSNPSQVFCSQSDCERKRHRN